MVMYMTRFGPPPRHLGYGRIYRLSLWWDALRRFVLSLWWDSNRPAKFRYR